MKSSKQLLMYAVLMLSVVLTSCEKEDPDGTTEGELITTLRYTLTSTATTDVVTLIYKDLDGEGSGAPEVVGGTLLADHSYIGVIEVLDESGDEVEDITVEVLEEAADHQFFFTTTVDNMAIEYDDSDPNGNPLGLKTTVTTGAAASGTLSIVLKHEPVKDAEGVASGDVTNAGGETDINVVFPIDVE